MCSRDDFLAGVTTLVKTQRVQTIEVQHVGSEFLTLLMADPRDAIANRFSKINGSCVGVGLKLDLGAKSEHRQTPDNIVAKLGWNCEFKAVAELVDAHQRDDATLRVAPGCQHGFWQRQFRHVVAQLSLQESQGIGAANCDC